MGYRVQEAPAQLKAAGAGLQPCGYGKGSVACLSVPLDRDSVLTNNLLQCTQATKAGDVGTQATVKQLKEAVRTNLYVCSLHCIHFLTFVLSLSTESVGHRKRPRQDPSHESVHDVDGRQHGAHLQLDDGVHDGDESCQEPWQCICRYVSSLFIDDSRLYLLGSDRRHHVTPSCLLTA